MRCCSHREWHPLRALGLNSFLELTRLFLQLRTESNGKQKCFVFIFKTLFLFVYLITVINHQGVVITQLVPIVGALVATVTVCIDYSIYA